MRTLRGLFRGTKIGLGALLVLTCASLLTISTARTANAEGFLFDTVRCVVRTVLTDECRQVIPVSPANAQASPASGRTGPPAHAAPQSNTHSSGASRPQAQAAPQSTGRSTTPPSGQTTTELQPLPMPEGEIGQIQTDSPITTPAELAAFPASRGDHITFFNMYSPYAGASVQGATSEGLVSTSQQGWKLLGLTWYWWMALAAVGVGVFLFLKHGILRKNPLLSE